MKRTATVLVLTVSLVVQFARAGVPSLGAVLGFTVNTTVDGPDDAPGDGRCQTAAGACSLRAAIMETNALGQLTSTVNVPAGTYHLSVMGSGEDGAATGDLDLRAGIKLLGTVGATVIVADSGFGDRVFDVPPGISADVTLNGLTIQGGTAPGTESGGGVRFLGSGNLNGVNVSFNNNSAGGSGGGLYQDAGTLTFNLITFTANSAGMRGGGLDLEGSVVTTNFTHLTVTANTAFQGGGMAAFVLPVATGSIPLLDMSTFTRNTTTPGGSGGGISVARTTVQKTTFTLNSAAFGGGVELVRSRVPSTLSGRIVITDNTATNSGGGLYGKNCGASCGSLLHVTLSRNTAANDGSAVYLTGGVSIEKTTINANQTSGLGASGGAVYHGGQARGPMVLTNVTIGENSNGPLAGAVMDASKSADQYNNVTIANNTGGTANGIAVAAGAAAPKLHGTIVSSGGANCTRPLKSLGYNLDSSDTCGLHNTEDQVNSDPLLHALKDGGGGTWTMSPGNGSPIIDRGDPVTCPVTDQRSVLRPVDGDGNGSSVCDIGAFETGVDATNTDLGFTSMTATVVDTTVTYTMILQNDGVTAGTDAILTDLLPSSLAFVSCTATLDGECLSTDNNQVVHFPALGVGQAPEVRITATILGSGLIVNSASLWSENPDWYPTNNTAAVSFRA